MQVIIEEIKVEVLTRLYPKKYYFRWQMIGNKLCRKLWPIEDINNKTHIGDPIARKFLDKPDQAKRDQHNFFMNQEAKGLLNAVDDSAVWKPLIKKYGRERLPEFK